MLVNVYQTIRRHRPDKLVFVVPTVITCNLDFSFTIRFAFNNNIMVPYWSTAAHSGRTI
jgi:hypothetical protein